MSPRPVAVVGAAAVSAAGLCWRGLASRTIEPARSRELEASDPGTLAFEVPPIPPAADAGDARARKAMSRPARLAAIAAREALADAGFRGGAEATGYFLGVGASGGPVSEMLAMLLGSLDAQGEVSPARLGAEGLAASNPLFTFHVLNNFTLCHGAILSGIQGPNAALFSRGGGTVTALREAAFAVGEGDCDRALAGGADTALHPVTWSELCRDGFAAGGLVPGEGAALLALERIGGGGSPLAYLERASVLAGRRHSLEEVLEAAVASEPDRPVDHLILAPWGEAARAALHRFARRALPGAPILDVTRRLGESLAATPALAWVSALDLLTAGSSARALVLSAGIDGDLGLVTLAREPHR